MIDLSKYYLFRMTHMDNITHILNHGITHKDSLNANPNFVSIGDNSIINTRNNIVLKNGKKLGEYIPFYFGIRMPMLYVIQKGYNGVPVTNAEEIVYCVCSVQKIIDGSLDFIFTDGHANDSLTTEYDKSDINNIQDLIDWKAVYSTFWTGGDIDKKRRKEAEFLVYGDIPSQAILGFGVYNETAKNKLISLGIEEKMIGIKKEFYF